MSADRQRLKSAIQRIAKQDPDIRGLLSGSQNKGGKASSAGVGVSDAERDRICCDGSTSSGANPGAEEREVGDSQGGLDSNDPADIGGGDGTLDGVTDCATGEPICFDGGGFIPPDGWDAPDEPIIDTSYEEGWAWNVTFTASSIDCCTASPTESLAQAKKFNPCSKPSFYDTRKVRCTSILTVCSHEVYEYACNPSEEDILANGGKWPSDGCTNLAMKGGKIVGSKYDPENDGSYSAPRDSIDLCDGSGNQISLAPAANGGWKTINSTTSNGYLYDSSGRQIAHIDGNEYADPSV